MATATLPRPTIAQEELALEFINDYDLNPEEVSFIGESVDPFFGFESLSKLAILLGDFPEITVVPEFTGHIVTSQCHITMPDGKSRSFPASAVVGEELHDGTMIKDIPQALYVANSRALRTGLRATGFNPVRAHRQRKAGEEVKPESPNEIRERELRRIHALAEECLLIDGKDKSAYYAVLNTHFPECKASSDLTPEQRVQFIAILDGKKKAQEAKLRNHVSRAVN